MIRFLHYMRDGSRGLTLAGCIGLAMTLFWLALALVGPAVAPYSPGAFVTYFSFEPATAKAWLGSDYLGRDVLSRTLTGIRYSIGISLVAAVLACAAGTCLAVLVAAAGSKVDGIVARLVDGIISIPAKIFALVIVGAFGSSIGMLIAVLVLTYAPGAFRIARALAINAYATDYVVVAKLRGEGPVYIAFKEVLPNIWRPMLADFGLRFILVMLLLSSLSFLGLGVQPPISDLGSLVKENASGYAEGALAALAPAICVAAIAISVNMLIDGLPGRERR